MKTSITLLFSFIFVLDSPQVSANSPLELLDETQVSENTRPHKIAGFDLEEVRVLVTHANLSYSDYGPDSATIKAIENLKNAGYETRFFLAESDHAGLLIMKDNHITISYHGSESYQDWLTDAHFTMTVPSFVPGKIHGGFYHAFNASWDDVYTIMYEYAQFKNLSLRDMDVTVTGHSMGAAIASVAGLRLAEFGMVKSVRVATFGSPRVFDEDAAKQYETLLGQNTLRVARNNIDIVPMLPPSLLGYKHVGQNLPIIKTAEEGRHNVFGYISSLLALSEDEFIANNSPRFFTNSNYNPLTWIPKAVGSILGGVQNFFSQLHWNLSPAPRAIEDRFREASPPKQVEFDNPPSQMRKII